MKDIRMEKLANNLLTYSVDIQKGDNILIEILGEEAIPLAKELTKQAEELGAKPQFNIINYEILRIMLENASEQQIKLYGQIDSNRMKKNGRLYRNTSNTKYIRIKWDFKKNYGII